MEDLIKRVEEATIIGDFDRVVAKSKVGRTFFLHYLPRLGNKRKAEFIKRAIYFRYLRFQESKRRNSNTDYKKIIEKKASLLEGINYKDTQDLIQNYSLFELNMNFVTTVNKLKIFLEVDKITIPIITRDDERYVEYWLETRRDLLNFTPKEYLQQYKISLEIIGNDCKLNKGIYTGEVESGEKSKILFHRDSLITLDKLDKYSLGGRKRIILIDNEEYRFFKKNGIPDYLKMINVQNRITLDKQIEEAKLFLS